MSTFMHKSGVKALIAILCVLSLTVACLCGACVVTMLVSGEYDGSGSLFEVLTERQLQHDTFSIMFNYFDPDDPGKPWKSYYSGGIYTGENSNFRYNITDTETGYSVLATIVGGEQIRYSNTYQHSYESESSTPAVDRFTIDSSAFICGDTVYYYDEEANYFTPMDTSQLTQYISGASVVSEDIVSEGFTYQGKEYTSVNVSEGQPGVASTEITLTDPAHFEYDGIGFYETEPTLEFTYESRDYTITGYVLQGLTANDAYRHISDLTAFLTSNRSLITGAFAISLLLGLVLLVLLLCGLCHVNGTDALTINPVLRLPPDVAVFCALFLVALLVCFTLELVISSVNFMLSLAFAALSTLACATILVYILSLLAARIKTGSLISGTVICWCLRKLRQVFRFLCSVAKKALRCLPLVWKVMVCYGILCFFEFILLLIFCYTIEAEGVFVWFLMKLALGALVGYVAMVFLRLKRGAESIAAGDYTTKVSEKHLVLDFKDTADTLNHIQDGMNAAVDSRMKSERLKTELITNVSHDIKTPLTSIVSYVDLLKKEPVASDRAKEYLDVLDRQSARLKKLVEDLVEASKASTGNITIHPEPMDLSVVLGQALGEYNERLLNARLTPVVHLPEEPVMISADGRLLWRIFDNLLGNAVKYAMPGTRIYVTLTADSHAIVTMRNISRDALDISADELKERFVRGDASRHTEGSGLGLSIAESLANSMGGEFLLSLDGDLFKVAVIFPLIADAAPEAD